MSKVKLNTGLASIILLASVFLGWSTLLIAIALMLLFCEINDDVKAVMVKVISFLIVITLVSMGWSIICEAFELLISTIENIVSIINSYLDYSKAINLVKFNRYFVTPLNYVFTIVGNIIYFIITLAKFGFIVSVLTNKKFKANFISKKINSFVNVVTNYINNLNSSK